MKKRAVDELGLDLSEAMDQDVDCPSGDACPWKPEVDKLRELVSTDTLTGLHNYRYFRQALDQEMERTRRTSFSTAVVMLDLDHFKKVNDNYGHGAGNTVLQTLADCMRQSFRKLDICCRYGGEEFVVILPATELLVAVHVAERLRATIEALKIKVEDNQGQAQVLQVTASLGIGLYSRNNVESAEEVIKSADRYLYKSKQAGRNRVCYQIAPLDDRTSVTQDEKDALSRLFEDDDSEPLE